MKKDLSCPPKAGGVCRVLVARIAEKGDKKRIMSILKRSFPHVYEKDKKFWSKLLDKNPTIVLEMNEKIIGASNIRRPQAPEHMSWLDLIAIDPDYRELGLGEILLDQSENSGRNMGADTMGLFAEVDNTPAVAFYSKNKWIVTDHTKWGYSHGHRLTMEKNL